MTNTLSKGQCLEMLMDCDDRLHNRYNRYWMLYRAFADIGLHSEAKHWLAKCDNVNNASTRIAKKINRLLKG